MQDSDIVITILDEKLLTKSPTLHRGRYKTFGTPETATVRILCSQKVIRAIENHAQRSMDREVGGILLGDAYQYKGNTYIEITEYIPAQSQPGQQSSRTHFTFTPEIWAQMNRDKDQYFDGLRTVGWFHSHPGHGIFLSPGIDTEIQEKFFTQPWQTAMVYDPHRHEAGFFIWQGSQVQLAPGFYELYDQNQGSIIKWKNLLKTTEKKLTPPNTRLNWVSVTSLVLTLAIFLMSFLSMLVVLDTHVSDQQRAKLEATINSRLDDLTIAVVENATSIEALQTPIGQIAQVQAEHTAAITELQASISTLQVSYTLTGTLAHTLAQTITNEAAGSTFVSTETQSVTTTTLSTTVTQDDAQTSTGTNGLGVNIALTREVYLQGFDGIANQEGVFVIPLGTAFQVCTPLDISVVEEITVSLWMSFTNSTKEIIRTSPEETLRLTSDEIKSYCVSLTDTMSNTPGLWEGDVYFRGKNNAIWKVSPQANIESAQDATVKIEITE